MLAAGLLVDQLRAFLSFGRSHTDQDQTILWYAGREFLRGRFYEPNFFGQRYNTTFEAIPGALLRIAGLPWGTALPAATTLLVTLIWVLFAATALCGSRLHCDTWENRICESRRGTFEKCALEIQQAFGTRYYYGCCR